MGEDRRAINSRNVVTGHAYTRRRLLKGAVALGMGTPVLAGLLAACGGSSSTPKPASTTSSSGAGPTPTYGTVPQAKLASPTEEASATAASTTTSGGSSGETPKQGGTMIVTGHQEISSLSPDDAGPTVHWVIVTQIHNAVLEMDENFILQPILGEKVEASPDGLTFTYHLRSGVKFHNGDTFSSADVKYTYDYYRNPDNAAVTANYYKSIDSVDATDDSTVAVKLTEPNAAFFNLTATQFIVNGKYHAEVGEKKYKTAPVGTGAFKLKEWIPASHTIVEAFDDHFRGRPHLDMFREDIVPEASVRAIALETGKADSAVWPLLSEDNLKLAGETDKFTTFRTSTLAVNHFPINNDLPFFADKQARQAMMFAIDRQKLIDDVFKGTAVIATANISPALKTFYEPDVAKYDYNPDKAKQMLDAAGWAVGSDGIRAKDGQRFSFTCTIITGDQARKPEAEVVQQELKAVGIEMKIAEAPVATITDSLRKGKMDASLFNWTYGGSYGDPDASVVLRSDGGNNWSHYNNPDVDKLLDDGLKEIDETKRKAIYSQIQKTVAEDVPFLFMMYWDWFNIFTNRIGGLPKTALSGSQLYRKANEWWIKS